MKSTILLAAVVALWSTSVLAVPNGKPFVELQGQIIEVQGAVAEIEARMTELEQSVEEQVTTLTSEVATLAEIVAIVGDKVDTFADTVAVNTRAIFILQRRTATLKKIVDEIASDLTTIQGSIDALTADNVDLQAQIDAGVADAVSLQAQIDANTVLITDLEVAMADNNFTLTGAIATQTNIENGTCNDGESVVAVSEGQIVCEVVNDTTTSSSAVVTLWRVSALAYYAGNNYWHSAPECPAGSVLTGGGFESGIYAYAYLRNKPATGFSHKGIIQGGDASTAGKFARRWDVSTYGYRHISYAICLNFN